MSKLVWITGLSGSGKSTIGMELYRRLKSIYKNYIYLDGDSFREILGNDLNYTQEERFENAKRIHRMCKFLISQNMNVVCATMSLYKEIHELNRKEIQNYFEVFIECDIEELIRRDQKEIYTQALKGERNDVVGINLPYDKPLKCDLIIDNTQQTKLEEKIETILKLIGES
jgi:adenylylsulfate kinase-like enzyme